MTEDARLDQFFTDADEDGGNEDGESDADARVEAGASDGSDAAPDAGHEDAAAVDDTAAEPASGADAESGADAVAEEADDDPSFVAPGDVAPADVTYSFHPDGTACEACGSTARRRFSGEDGLVCADCKRWRV